MVPRPLSAFVDTGVIVALHNRRDFMDARAVELFKKALSNDLGPDYTSDYIFDEAVTFALRKTSRPDLAISLGSFILDEDRPLNISTLSGHYQGRKNNITNGEKYGDGWLAGNHQNNI